MNLFPIFQTVLYTISTALLAPVVIALILLCLWLFLYAGGFCAEWIKRGRRKSASPLADAMEEIQASGQLPKHVRVYLPVHIVTYADEIYRIIKQNSAFADERIENVNQKTENALLKSVDKIRLIVRIGPSLGLMGTLIPMGTGLSGLTQGNMTQLSASLILAFTTTVVGLALGISAHFFAVTKEHWMLEDMRRIALITEALTKHSIPNDSEIDDAALYNSVSHNKTNNATSHNAPNNAANSNVVTATSQALQLKNSETAG